MAKLKPEGVIVWDDMLPTTTHQLVLSGTHLHNCTNCLFCFLFLPFMQRELSLHINGRGEKQCAPKKIIPIFFYIACALIILNIESKIILINLKNEIWYGCCKQKKTKYSHKKQKEKQKQNKKQIYSGCRLARTMNRPSRCVNDMHSLGCPWALVALFFPQKTQLLEMILIQKLSPKPTLPSTKNPR